MMSLGVEGSSLGPLVSGKAARALAESQGIAWVAGTEVVLQWLAGVVTAVSSLRIAKRPDVALYAMNLSASARHTIARVRAGQRRGCEA